MWSGGRTLIEITGEWQRLALHQVWDQHLASLLKNQEVLDWLWWYHSIRKEQRSTVQCCSNYSLMLPGGWGRGHTAAQWKGYWAGGRFSCCCAWSVRINGCCSQLGPSDCIETSLWSRPNCVSSSQSFFGTQKERLLLREVLLMLQK